MYTITTIILVVQSVYYEYVVPQKKLVRAVSEPVPSAEEQALLAQQQAPLQQVRSYACLSLLRRGSQAPWASCLWCSTAWSSRVQP